MLHRTGVSANFKANSSLQQQGEEAQDDHKELPHHLQEQLILNLQDHVQEKDECMPPWA